MTNRIATPTWFLAVWLVLSPSGWSAAATSRSAPAASAPATGPAGGRAYEGFTALVAEPENSWSWDAAIFGALQERGFDVTYGGAMADPAFLQRFDMVALNIRRGLSAGEQDALKKYVAEGGAVYGSWGGPMEAGAFAREVCGVGGTRSLKLKQLTLLKGPLSEGIGAGAIGLSARAGHVAAGAAGWEIVSVEAAGAAVPVATDDAGHCLGVLNRFGKGRTAVLGFGPEQDKYLAQPELAPRMLDNLLAWLLEGKPGRGRTAPTGRITVAVPARADVREVRLGSQLVAAPPARQVGSLKKIELDVSGLAVGAEAVIRVALIPYPVGRHVHTWIHLPWNTLRPAAKSPAALAEYLKSVNATVVQPLLRGPFGEAWYAGMPQDKPDDKLVKEYRGDFLRDLVAECKTRHIVVIGGIYFDSVTPIAKYPEVKRLDRQGKEMKDQYGRCLACFHNPKGQEHNLDTVRDLLAGDGLGGVILDDNFELDKNECFCPYCKEAFRVYCQANGLTYQDPAKVSGGALAQAWRRHRQQETMRLAEAVRKIAADRHVQAGGWVGAGMDVGMLAESFDFLGGMVYSAPPRAARGALALIGPCEYVCLLWAPDSPPAQMEREVRQAVHAGCPAVGFWIRGDDGGYRLDPARTAAVARAFAGVESEWLAYYRDNLLTGDVRFAVVDGRVGREELVIRVRNVGPQAGGRQAARVDLSALEVK